jgi:acetylornithine deacetylase
MQALEHMQAPAPQAGLEQAADILSRLIAFDTESSKSNLDLIAWVEAYLAGLGIASLRVPNAAGDKAALFATIGPVVDGGVVLSGHSDVVPVEGQIWTGHPFTMRRDNGRIYGRGACDMKGFVAIVLAMASEWKALPLQAPLHILISYDEETTCLGPVDTIARFGVDLPRPRAVIVGEPTMMQVVDAHKAVATYRTVVTGREAHSSKPALGANAVQGACELVHELYRIGADIAASSGANDRFDPPVSTVHVGTISGGTARNILARECVFHWEFRALPGVPLDAARVRLDAYARDVLLPRLRETAPEADVVTATEVEVPGLAPEPGSEAETLALRLTKSNRTHAVAFATEGGRFQAGRVATVVCGPGSIDQAHQPDEYITEAQIEAGIAFMRDLGLAMC